VSNSGHKRNTCHGTLSQVVEDGKPPTRDAVAELFPNESFDETTERFHAAMRDYQQENTQLFFLIAPSLNLNGPWEQNDIETIQRDFAETPRSSSGECNTSTMVDLGTGNLLMAGDGATADHLRVGPGSKAVGQRATRRPKALAGGHSCSRLVDENGLASSTGVRRRASTW